MDEDYLVMDACFLHHHIKLSNSCHSSVHLVMKIVFVNMIMVFDKPRYNLL